jgi:foldase protein PrsA
MNRIFSAMLLLAAIGVWRPLPALADGATAASVAGTASPAREPAAADIVAEVVANVNGQPVSRDQLAALCIHFDGKEVLETLIQYELIRQEAVKQGVTASKEEIEAHVKNTVKEQLDARARINAAKDFADWVAKNGVKPEDAARQVKEAQDWLRPFGEPELLARKILLKSVVKVTEADVRAEFDRRYGPKAKVLQIVLRSDADAEDVIQKLKLGADFVELAHDVSVDNVSRRKGGEISPLGHGSPLGDAAFKLKPGQFSGPVQTPDGVHVLKLVEIQPPVDKRFEDVKDELQESLTALRLIEERGKWLDDLFAKAKITRNL